MAEFDAPDIYNVVDRKKRFVVFKLGRKTPEGAPLCAVIDREKNNKRMFEGTETQCYAWVLQLTMEDVGGGQYDVISKTHNTTLFTGSMKNAIDYIYSAYKHGIR